MGSKRAWTAPFIVTTVLSLGPSCEEPMPPEEPAAKSPRGEGSQVKPGYQIRRDSDGTCWLEEKPRPRREGVNYNPPPPRLVDCPEDAKD
jgi:hypothetical protein